jgi:apolipoprotein N-acyltransferase
MTNPVRARVVQASGAIVFCLAAFNFFGLLIFLGPGLLGRALYGLDTRKSVGCSLVWGALFTALFHLWSLNHSLALWVLIIVLRGLPWLLFPVPSLIFRRLGKTGIWPDALATGLGSALVCLALLSGPSGFDWETPIAPLTQWPWCLALLPWTGLVGGSFLIGLISHFLVASTSRPRLWGAGLLAIWLSAHALVWMNLEARPVSSSIALLQTGWEEHEKWDPKNARKAADRLFEMTRQARGMGAELVIWPETAWPVRGLLQSKHDAPAISDLARELQVDLLVSSIEERTDVWYNTVALVGSNGQFGAVYEKRRLLPFSEFVPVSDSWASSLYRAGSDATVFDTQGKTFSVLICFESMVPGPARDYSETDFLVVVTNDSETRSEFAKEAHFRSAVLRAAQERKPIYQCANNGVSGVIDHRGVVVLRTPSGFTGAKILKWDEVGPPDGIKE